MFKGYLSYVHQRRMNILTIWRQTSEISNRYKLCQKGGQS